mgnify:CR=1 FL=1
MRKKYILKNKKRFLMFLMVVLSIFYLLFFACTIQGYKEREYKVINVSEGDTLWDIALENDFEGDIRQYIYEIKKVNNLNESTIYSGSSIKIPID